MINRQLSLFNKFRWLLGFLVFPKSKDKDLARREFILNILLLGSVLLALVANIKTWVNELLATPSQRSAYAGSSIEVLVIFLFFLICYFMSRLGRSRWVAYILIILYLAVTAHSLYRWGADIPEGLLTFALIIVMSGILINSRFSFIVTAVISLIIIILVYLQGIDKIHVTSSWRSQHETVGNAVVFSITLFVIALVSWLFNRESEKLLKRAHLSEMALRRQRDKLEVMVEKRTAQLKQTQVEKLAQLYRFAEFGRSAAGLFHDLVNPINLVSLNLSRLSPANKRMKKQTLVDTQLLLGRAMIGIKRLESFVEAARKQIQNQQVLKRFSVVEEINQVLQVIEHKARQSQVRISFIYDKDIITYGNPIKFNQLISNLVSNAIDAYDKIKRDKRAVEINLQKTSNNINLTVQDLGKGIPSKLINKIFEPLFTTKDFNKGTGIGLSICKDIVEKDFQGQILVDSKVGQGTAFMIQFPLRRFSKK